MFVGELIVVSVLAISVIFLGFDAWAFADWGGTAPARAQK